MTLAQLRRDLASAKIALRAAKDELATAQAIAEQNIINANGGNIGKNENERARFLTIYLAGSETYMQAFNYLRDCESEVDRLSTEVLICEDSIRENEARIREKLADALMGKRLDNAIDDSALDGNLPW